jgi:hypothetical protein
MQGPENLGDNKFKYMEALTRKLRLSLGWTTINNIPSQTIKIFCSFQRDLTARHTSNTMLESVSISYDLRTLFSETDLFFISA